MKITVFEGTATLTVEIPVFVGTTGKGEPGATNFPILGTPLKKFLFYPEKGDAGTLVFDHADLAQRNAFSPTLFQYWWEKNKLVVKEGAPRGWFKHPMVNSKYGYRVELRDPTAFYYTYNPGGPWGPNDKLVSLLDLLRFMEGKTEREKLDTHATMLKK